MGVKEVGHGWLEFRTKEREREREREKEREKWGLRSGFWERAGGRLESGKTV